MRYARGRESCHISQDERRGNTASEADTDAETAPPPPKKKKIRSKTKQNKTKQNKTKEDKNHKCSDGCLCWIRILHKRAKKTANQFPSNFLLTSVWQSFTSFFFSPCVFPVARASPSLLLPLFLFYKLTSVFFYSWRSLLIVTLGFLYLVLSKFDAEGIWRGSVAQWVRRAARSWPSELITNVGG